MSGLRSWPALFRVLVLPVLGVWLHPCRTRRRIRDLEESVHLALKAFVVHLEREHPDRPRERHLHAVD
jgi:hypothetical protein